MGEENKMDKVLKVCNWVMVGICGVNAVVGLHDGSYLFGFTMLVIGGSMALTNIANGKIEKRRKYGKVNPVQD